MTCRSLSLMLVLGLAAPVFAEAPAAAPSDSPALEARAEADAPAAMRTAWSLRRVEIAVQGRDADTDSSRFLEYRSLPNGPVLPFARFAGDDGKVRYDLWAERLIQDDAYYSARIEGDRVGFEGSYLRIAHRFGNGARSLLTQGDADNLMSATLRQAHQSALETLFATNKPGINFAFLNALLSPSLAAADRFDLSLQRDIGTARLDLTKGRPVELSLDYRHEKRTGIRNSGTSFGFSNVVETGEPIDYRTQDFGLTARYGKDWGAVTAGVRYNKFTNHNPFQTFSNPFRATDATDASAYSSPGAGSIGGAALGRLALPPTNEAATGKVAVDLKFAKKTRVHADVSYGQWTQDETFIPFTTNTAITVPFNATDPAHLPAASLDGKIDVLSANAVFNTRPVDGLNLNARLRHYDAENKTPRLQFHEGYTRFDAVWEEIPRISVPYSNQTDQAQLSANYAFAKVTAEVGYKLEMRDRTFRETEKTTQNLVYASAHVSPTDRFSLRGTVEVGSRSFDGEYDVEHSEDASFLEPEGITNQAGLRRFDQADRDVTRAVVMAEFNPIDELTLSASYVLGKDEYTDSPFGLQDAKNQSFTVQADVTPSDRATIFAYYTREDITTFQIGRQSGSTPSVNPLDDWTADIEDKIDAVGGGAVLTLVPDKWNLRLDGSYQKVDGNNDLSATAGGAPANARLTVGGVRDIAAFDDTTWMVARAELSYQWKKGLTFGLGGWFEDYELDDVNTDNLPNYVPGSLFLAGNDGDYQAYGFYGRASYAW